MKTFLERNKYVLMTAILGIMFAVMIGSMRGDSAIRDEMPHIAAGYSYLKTGDYRINPEHPPLIKDLAAVPLLFMSLNFPYQYFYENLNSQWDIGDIFLYEEGNNADKMLFNGRMPIILLSLVLGIFVFKWAKDLYGLKAGFLALFLYAFDANIIAHSRFITTDLGVAVAFFIHLYFLWKFLKKPCIKNLFITGITFGIVLITKFSAALLAPIYFLILLYLILSKKNIVGKEKIFSVFADKDKFKKMKGYIWAFLGIFLIGFILMYIFYIPHVVNMSTETQQALIDENLAEQPFNNIVHKVSNISKPLGQYLLGFFMVFAHVAGGHTIYFMNQVGNGFANYYPIVFAIKTPIPEFVFLAITLLFWRKFKDKDYFSEYFLWVPVVCFFGIAMRGSLNLGIRYLLPIYPFLFVFVSKTANLFDFESAKEFFKGQRNKVWSAIGCALFTGILLWHSLGSLSLYPHYLTFFNEFVGGSKNGAKWVTDSNLDWGQDLKRLAKYVEKNNISDIKIDYFGGGNLDYYFRGNASSWRSEMGEPKGYFAISASYYSQARARGDYEWLKDEKPEKIIGNSIYVYKF